MKFVVFYNCVSVGYNKILFYFTISNFRLFNTIHEFHFVISILSLTKLLKPK